MIILQALKNLIFSIRLWLNEPILNKLKEIQTTMAQDQVALDTALKQLGDILTSEDASVDSLIAAVTALLAKIQSNPGADFTQEVTALQSMVADVTAKKAALDASVTSAS